MLSSGGMLLLCLPSIISAFAPFPSVIHQEQWKHITVPKPCASRIGPVTSIHSIGQSTHQQQQPSSPGLTTLTLFYHDDRGTNEREPSPQQRRLGRNDDDNNNNNNNNSIDWERSINHVLRASQKSFKHVESGTNRLLNRQPLIALAIFIGAGAMVAYMMGTIFLGGYIETWNPAENDVVPYWDDPVLVIERKVGR